MFMLLNGWFDAQFRKPPTTLRHSLGLIDLRVAAEVQRTSVLLWVSREGENISSGGGDSFIFVCGVASNPGLPLNPWYHPHPFLGRAGLLSSA